MVWTSFECEFDTACERLTRRLECLDQLATLLHRSHVHDALEQQRALQLEMKQNLEHASTATSSQRQDIIAWLSPVDWTEVLRRNLEKRSHGTCQWIRRQSTYKAWIGRSKSEPSTSLLFWIHGNAGMGKTVLCASIIQHLLEEENIEPGDTSISPPLVLLYFFFDKKDDGRNSIVHMYRTFLSQLLANPHSASAALSVLTPTYRSAVKYCQSAAAHSGGLHGILKQIMADLQHLRVFILVDALDECVEQDASFADLVDMCHSVDHCRMLVLSRYLPEMRNTLLRSSELKLTAAHTRSDVDMYLSNSFSYVPGQMRNADVQLLSKLSREADGWFLWANLAVEQLKAAVSPSDIWATALHGPEKLCMAYDMALQLIVEKAPSSRVRLIRGLLRRVLCSPRPLSWPELQHSLSVEPDTPGDGPILWEARRPFLDALLKMCPPFIEYSSENDTFRAHHLSAHQFLTVQHAEDDTTGLKVFPPLAHCELARVCLAYLDQPGLQDDVSSTLDSSKYPLALYATTYFCHHLTKALPNPQLCKSVASFFFSETKRRLWMMRWLLLKANSFPIQVVLKHLGTVREWLGERCASTTDLSPALEMQEFSELHDTIEILSHWGDLSLPPSCSDFQRIMVLRDLVRECKRENQITASITYLEALKERLESQQSQSAGTLWILMGLGLLYDQQGQVQRALEVQYKALALQGYNQQIIQTGPTTAEAQELGSLEEALTLNELGRLHRHLGNWHESQAMHQRALAILRHLGCSDDDPQILWTLATLARCYRKGGSPSVGLRLGMQALSGRMRLLGGDHPHTLWTMSDVAKCHRQCGDLVAACALQEESTRLRIQSLGPLHHDTLWSMNDLGLMYEMAGEEEKAWDMHRKAWEGQKNTLGADHKTTCWSQVAIEELEMARISEMG